MRKWKRFAVIALLLVVLLMAGAVVAALAMEPAAPAATGLNWQFIASGGATMESASFTMLSTTGQPVAGMTSGTNYSVLSGYWYGFQEFVRNVFLPIIMR